MPNPPSKSNTGAVVVVFHPGEVFADNLRAVRFQVDHLLIVDNTPAKCAWLTDLAAESDADIVGDGVNYGVGHALNLALTWAKNLGLEWLLTLDQDSQVYESLVPVMRQVFDSRIDRDTIGIIGANYVEPHRSEAFRQMRPDAGQSNDTPWVITSGSLISIAATDIIGPFRGDWFIDLIDLEYCLRVRSRHLKVILTAQPLMEHAVGEPTWFRALGRKLSTPNHSPSRHYYATRNLLLLTRQYLLRESRVVRSLMTSRLKEIILMLLCESDRPAKLSAILKGTLDGLLGRIVNYNS